MKKHYVLYVLLAFFSLGFSQGDPVIVTIKAENIEGPTATGSATGITSTGFLRGTGVELAGNVSDIRHRSRRWDATDLDEAISNNEYVEWQVIPEGGAYSVKITRIDLNVRRVPSGPTKFQILYSLDNFATAGIAMGNEQTTPTSFANNGGVINIFGTAEAPLGETITFRLYAYNAGGNGPFVFGGKSNWSAFDITNPGLRLRGKIEELGPMEYGTWNFPGIGTFTGWLNGTPSEHTGMRNARIVNGTYSVPAQKHVQVKNLLIEPGATTEIGAATSITANSTVTNNGTLELNSVSTSYSSLIADNVSGEVIYNRHVNQVAATGSTTGNNDLISAPVTGFNQSFAALKNANPQIPTGLVNNVQTYLFGPFDNSADVFVNFTNADNNVIIAPGTGYRTASTASEGSTFKFVGDVLTNDVNVNINSGAGSVFNLIGNPYPSYLKLSTFLASNNTKFDPINSGVYGYQGNNETLGYAIWNQAYSDANPTALIAPGQGFLVASKQGGAVVDFTPTMRSVGSTNDFILRSPENLANLTLSLAKEGYKYQTDLYFNDNASLGMDSGYDSAMFETIAPDFSIYTRLVEDNIGKNMAAQSVSYSDLQNVTIPLGIHLNQGDQAVVSIANHNIPVGTSVILEDNSNNSFTNLLEGDYIFTANETLSGTGRFYIHFSQVALGLEDSLLNGLEIYTSQSPKAVIIKGQLEGQTTFKLYDIQGRAVLSQVLNSNSTEHTIDVSNIKTGIYIVELNNTTNSRTQKIILK